MECDVELIVPSSGVTTSTYVVHVFLSQSTLLERFRSHQFERLFNVL